MIQQKSSPVPKRKGQFFGFATQAKFAALLFGPLLKMQGNWRAGIPFEFHFDQDRLPPGEYAVAMSGGEEGIKLRNRRTGQSFEALWPRREAAKSEPKLVFHRYGRHHFLRQIWLQDLPGFILEKTNAEREMGLMSDRAVVSVPMERR